MKKIIITLEHSNVLYKQKLKEPNVQTPMYAGRETKEQ